MKENKKDLKQIQLEWIKSHPVSIEYKFFPNPKTKKQAIKTNNKKIKKKYFYKEKSVDEEIDLHGYTIDEGIFETEKSIQRAIEFDLKNIRVIFGTSKSPPPNLKSEIMRSLKTELRSKYLRLEIEPHNSGAVIIHF